MSEEKDVLEQLSDLLKELPSSYAPTVSSAVEAIKTHRRISNDMNGMLIANKKAIVDLEGDAKVLRDENDRLRGLLHHEELEVARLQGYQQRVMEFDPVSDRDQYEDHLPQRRRAGGAFVDNMASAMVRDSDLRASKPWYSGRRG